MPISGDHRNVPEDAPAQKIVPVVSTTPFPVSRGLWSGTAGTADIVDGFGNIIAAFPLVAGYNPICATKVTFGTVTAVWALY